MLHLIFFTVVKRKADDFVKMPVSSQFSKLEAQCLRDGVLFEDTKFPAEDTSLDANCKICDGITWKRPKVCIRTIFKLVTIKGNLNITRFIFSLLMYPSAKAPNMDQYWFTGFKFNSICLHVCFFRPSVTIFSVKW